LHRNDENPRKARKLAQADADNPEILSDNAIATANEAAARKWQLLVELERERMVRHASGDTSETYIASQHAPEPAPQPERRAA
jgi:hypothetical protein